MDSFVDTVINALVSLVAGIAGAVASAVAGVLGALGSIVPAGWLPIVAIGLILLCLGALTRR